MPVRARLPSVLALLLLAGASRLGMAEDLPGTGVFEGVYHKDRWGRAQVSFLVIPKALEAQFAPHEGKRIRLVVTKGGQQESPGPVFVQQVASVERVREGPRLALDIHRAAGQPPGTWMVSVTNRGADAATIHVGHLELRHWHRVQPEGASRAWTTHAEATPLWGRRPAQGPGRVEIPPGGRCAFPFHVAVEDPSSELEARYIHSLGEVHVPCPYRRWVRPDEGIAPLAPPGLRLRDAAVAASRTPFAGDASRTDGSYVLTGSLVPSTKEALFPIRTFAGVSAVPMRVRAYDGEGVAVRVDCLPFCDDGLRRPSAFPRATSHRIGRLPGPAYPVRVHIWRSSWFHERPIARLVLEVLGADGVVRIPVAAPRDDTLRVVPPPFGPAHGGVRLRVRAVPRRAGRSVSFVIQAVNDAGSPRIVFAGDDPGCALWLLIDGHQREPLDLGRSVFGWAVPHTCGEALEWMLPRRPVASNGPGAHTLQLVVRGSGGTYRNTRHEDIPILEGEIRSAPTAFRVR